MLPTASEEIVDPHNLFLEVWATAGFLALLCLLTALAWAFWNLFGRARPPIDARSEVDRLSRRERRRARAGRRDGTAPSPLDDQDDCPPARTGWLMLSAGAGWALVVVFGWLDPFQADLFPRWLILGAAWLARGPPAACHCGIACPYRRIALAAGAIATLVNLLASGGIGIPTVALGLWSIIALGQNLRDDRKCSSTLEYESRMPSLGLAVAWSAAFGTFIGLVTPFWQCEAAVARGEAAMSLIPPNYEAAHDAFLSAATADGYSARPWLYLAVVYERQWRDKGAKAADNTWMKVPMMYDKAAEPPRNPWAWSIHNERAIRIHAMLRDLAPQLDPLQLTKYRGKIVEATRTASRLNPTNSELHARLAHASADISMFADAVAEAKEALRLDGITPHADRKLPESVRRRLEDMIPKWSASAEKMPTMPGPH